MDMAGVLRQFGAAEAAHGAGCRCGMLNAVQCFRNDRARVMLALQLVESDEKRSNQSVRRLLVMKRQFGFDSGPIYVEPQFRACRGWRHERMPQ